MVFPMVWALLFVGLHGFPAFPAWGHRDRRWERWCAPSLRRKLSRRRCGCHEVPIKLGGNRWAICGKNVHLFPIYILYVLLGNIYIWKYTDSSMVSTVIINFWTSKNHKNKWTYLEHIWIWKDMMLQNPGHPAVWRLFAEAYKPTGDW